MGLSMIPGAGLSTGRASGATPLLAFLAGAHADEIARVWPRPHTGFLSLPAERRHAAAILLARLAAGETTLDAREIAMTVERARGRDLAMLLAGEPRAGLMKALGRLGETLWSAGEYTRFLELFAEPEAARLLRHMREIRPAQLKLVDGLPVALRRANIISLVPGLAAAQDLAMAYKLTLRIRGDGVGPELANRWDRARKAIALFDRAAEDLRPVSFGTLPPVPVLPAPFEAVGDRKALERVALEFENCLRDFGRDLARSIMAVYVWRGSIPAVIALRVDPAGWRLAEAETRGNDGIDDAPLREIVTAIEAAGVRTGVSVWTLAHRLHRHGCSNCGPDARKAHTGWRDALELGDLWDG